MSEENRENPSESSAPGDNGGTHRTIKVKLLKFVEPDGRELPKAKLLVLIPTTNNIFASLYKKVFF